LRLGRAVPELGAVHHDGDGTLQNLMAYQSDERKVALGGGSGGLLDEADFEWTTL
jgi:hypothetical protein